MESLATVKTGMSEVYVDILRWLACDSQVSYNTWRHIVPARGKQRNDRAAQENICYLNLIAFVLHRHYLYVLCRF